MTLIEILEANYKGRRIHVISDNGTIRLPLRGENLGTEYAYITEFRSKFSLAYGDHIYITVEYQYEPKCKTERITFRLNLDTDLVEM